MGEILAGALAAALGATVTFVFALILDHRRSKSEQHRDARLAVRNLVVAGNNLAIQSGLLNVRRIKVPDTPIDIDHPVQHAFEALTAESVTIGILKRDDLKAAAEAYTDHAAAMYTLACGKPPATREQMTATEEQLDEARDKLIALLD